MEPIVTTELPAPVPQREPTDAEIEAAKEVLAQLEAEARALGAAEAAAPLHHAMGRIWIEQLGDEKNAAVCYQNAYFLNPKYRPNLEAARRLFASAGRYEKALALHQLEEAMLDDPAHRAESLRAQAMLARELGRADEARELIDQALQLAPEHPALLKAAVEAAQHDGDRVLCARLLVRSAGSMRDPVAKAQLLRRAVLLVEELLAEPSDGAAPPPTEPARPPPSELEALHEEAVRKLHQADANDPVGFLAMLLRSRKNNDWEAVLRLCRARAERSGSPADRALVAAIAAYRLGRVSEGLAEVKAALEDHRRDAALLALRSELAEQQKLPNVPELLRQRAEGCIEPSERGHLKFRAAMLLDDPLEREQLLSDALAENPGDAAAIALHARVVALRDATSAADRFIALGEALESHSPEEAAAHFLEAGAWQERSGNREAAATMARRALHLVPRHMGALRLLMRALPLLDSSAELADLLEEAAAQLPRAVGAEMMARAAALVTGSQPERAQLLLQRAADMARGLTTPRWLETWSMLAFRSGDHAQLSQALEARADSTQGADSADLLLEASELARAVGDEPRATALLHKARGVDPHSIAARNALLTLATLPSSERIDLLAEEARITGPERAAALHAERAALLEQEGRLDEAVQACAPALALAGLDLPVLRRLARLQLRRGDYGAALAVLVQIAEAVGEGHPRAEAYDRAAELAEWRVGDPRRAIELYRSSALAWPQAGFAWTQLGRLHSWTANYVEAAEAYQNLAAAAETMSERNEARRWAASLYSHRAGQPDRAAAMLRALLADAPGDLEATAELLALIGQDQTAEARRERAELRGRLASRCQDPRVAALLRSESAEDRLAAGERDQGIAEFRRALALNPQDRVALDLVEEALRSSGQKSLLAEHLAFRCAYAEGDTRAALALQQAEIFTEQGRLQEAGAAYQQALASDPDSLLALKGARHIADLTGDKQEAMRLLAKEASVASGRTLEPDGEDARALEARAESAEASGRPQDAADALQKLARGYLALGQPQDALAAFKRAVHLEPSNRTALRQVADLSSQRAPEDSISAHRALLEMTPPPVESLHALFGLFRFTGKSDAAFCTAATLVGLGAATPEEKTVYGGIASRPPPADLPQLADSSAVHAPGDEGPARELLSAAAAELARALPTDMSGGRGALVKGDNPVRRVVAAIARALGMPEPQIFLARAEPEVVAPVAGDAPGILVGAEVPKRFTPRQQRFLYARALAQIRRGSHAVADLSPAQLGAALGALARLAAPAGTDFSRLPSGDDALAERLAQQMPPEARSRLAPLAAVAAAEPLTDWEPLALGIRESAERAGMAVSGDPAAALSIVVAECQGGLDKPEVARLARFAISEAYLAIRSR